MSVTFLHTADWQLGKPFAGVDDPTKRARLQAERFTVLQRLAGIARQHAAEFILVAGDLFDSPNATKATVAAACSAIGALGVPVLAIPGNHDHGGPGSLWAQEFFRREQAELAPNFRILLTAEPVELASAVLFPCPLLRRHEMQDPTAWLRNSEVFAERFGNRPRIVLAHGSVLNFGAASDPDEPDAGPANLLDLSRFPEGFFDYVALGDWHGTKQISPHSWYSGTPELDRFVKGSEHNPGNVLMVSARRGAPPVVHPIRTGALRWHELTAHFTSDESLLHLKAQVESAVGHRANEDLLRLQLTGTLGIEAATQLEHWIESWSARLLRVKLENQTTLAPSAAEVESLTRRVGDPLLARVAAKLVALAADADEPAAVARTALRALHAVCQTR